MATRTPEQREREKEYSRRYYQENKERIKARNKKWREENPDKTAKHRKDFRKRSPKYTSAWSRRERKRIRQQILEKYGGKCVRCGIDDPRLLQVDHVEGDGRGEKRRLAKNMRKYYLGVLKDKTGKYQLLCANCNWLKRYERDELL